MFKKLEEDKTVFLAADETPESECPCGCSKSVEKSEEPKPEANTLAVQLAVYYDING